MATLLFSFWIAFNMYKTNTNTRKWVKTRIHVGCLVVHGSFKCWDDNINFLKYVKNYFLFEQLEQRKLDLLPFRVHLNSVVDRNKLHTCSRELYSSVSNFVLAFKSSRTLKE